MERVYLHDCGTATHFDDDDLPMAPKRVFGHSVFLQCDGCNATIAIAKSGLPAGTKVPRGKQFY